MVAGGRVTDTLSGSSCLAARWRAWSRRTGTRPIRSSHALSGDASSTSSSLASVETSAVGRELKMIELKKEIEYLKKLGLTERDEFDGLG